MKKIFLGVAAIPLLALLATSCANETVETKDDLGRELTFKAVTGKQTLSRASETGITDLERTGVQVHTYADDGSLYRTFDLEHTGELYWNYGTKIFHPINRMLFHYSIYPADAATIDDQTYPFSFTYDAFPPAIGPLGGDLPPVTDPSPFPSPVATESGVDLLAATTTTYVDPYHMYSRPVAEMNYKHILAQVNFAVLGKEGLIITVSDMSVRNVHTKGVYSFDDPSNNIGSWAVTAGDYNDYYYVYADGTTTMTTVGDAADEDKYYYLGNDGLGGNNDKNNALMLIPQAIEPGTYLYFECELTSASDGTIIDSGRKMVLLDQFTAAWEAGKRYLYTIAFDPELLEFSVDIPDDWADENIEIPHGSITPFLS